MNKAFAEVIASSLTSWLAQSWQWDLFPAFGSLVVVPQGERTLIGIIHQITTGSLDPMRTPFAYQKTEEELSKEQPQIFEFLKTTFSCWVMGYQENGAFYYQLAPNPPKIHAFVYNASSQFYKDFFADQRYLHLLFSHASQSPSHEELLLALLALRAQHQALSSKDLVGMAETFCLLTGNDYKRLKIFLHRAQALITQ